VRWVDALPRPVRELRAQRIPLADGVQLAARIWLPEDAESDPVPAILEYIPYRQNDGTVKRDAIAGPYVAGHGYAYVRVDLRGSGDSEGVLEDEYLQLEQDDALEVMRWLEAQPWCTGRVGMTGISWGGFNALQVAARQPPQLGAIITICSTDDRYADDVHHMGGCLLGDNLSWASIMFAYNAMPPDPANVGDAWRAMWTERLEGSGLWLEKWLRHQRRDAYWRHGSVCEDFSAIRCPVYAVSGWADGYSNAVFRLLAGLDVPRKGLIGPWSHKFPHHGRPGPAIGFLQESIRWWDRWLKDRDDGIMREPMLRVWMQDSVPPTTKYDERPGRWVAERRWPSGRDELVRFPFARGRLGHPGERGSEAELEISSPLSVGLFAGKWCSYADTPDLPHDQREEDGGALVFESDPLAEPIEILGAPAVDLDLRSDRAVAMVAVRLSDVSADQKATRVTYGLLNLTHRDGSESPAPLEPGTHYHVRIRLNDIAQRFPAGHRLRISVSTSYFPLAWPPPEPATLTLRARNCALTLPVRTASPLDDALEPFGPPEGARPCEITWLETPHHNWWVIRDLAADESTLRVLEDHGSKRLEAVELTVTGKTEEFYRHRADDYATVEGETRAERAFERGDWRVRIRTRTLLSSTPTHFRVRAELDAFESEARIFAKSWDVAVPRDLV